MNITIIIMFIIDPFIYNDEVRITYFVYSIITLIIGVIILLLLLILILLLHTQSKHEVNKTRLKYFMKRSFFSEKLISRTSMVIMVSMIQESLNLWSLWVYYCGSFICISYFCRRKMKLCIHILFMYCNLNGWLSNIRTIGSEECWNHWVRRMNVLEDSEMTTGSRLWTAFILRISDSTAQYLGFSPPKSHEPYLSVSGNE